jgi:hypothetical protein
MAKLNQEQLLEIFDALKKVMKPYEKGVIRPQIDIQGRYDQWANKKVFAANKWRDEFAFTGLILQSGYVGFYYMPIYTNTEEVRPLISAELLKSLKGKSCFHIKKVDKDVLEQVAEAMRIGYDQYEKNGWL